MAENIDIDVFDLKSLEELSHIIGDYYTGSELTRFFERAGFPEIQHDGTTKWWFVYIKLQDLQNIEGPEAILRILERLYNPKESMSKDTLSRIDSILDNYQFIGTQDGRIVKKVYPPESLKNLKLIAQHFHKVANQLAGPRYKQRPVLEINDEYDIQYLFHALMLLFFEDVRPEEYTPSYAGANSRIDFLLKQEGAVVEIKMVRSNLGLKELRNQLLIDIASYRSHSDCKTFVAFVYDPKLLLKNPVSLESDLSKPVNGMEVLVMVYPK